MVKRSSKIELCVREYLGVFPYIERKHSFAPTCSLAKFYHPTILPCADSITKSILRIAGRNKFCYDEVAKIYCYSFLWTLLVAQHLFSDNLSEHHQQICGLVRDWLVGQRRAQAVLDELDATKERTQAIAEIDLAQIEHAQGYIQHYLGNLSTSIIHYERALRTFKKNNSVGEMALILSNQSENYLLRGNYAHARSLCRRGYELATQLNHIPLQSYAIINEGWIMFDTTNHETAFHTFETGHRLTEQWDENDPELARVRCEVHHANAQLLLRMKDYKSALKQASLAHENADLAGDKLSLGLSYRTFGDVMTLLTNVPDTEFDDPDAYYRTALSTFQGLDAQIEIARTFVAHANSLAQRGRIRSAAKLLQDAIDLFTQLGLHEAAKRAAATQLLVTQQM